MAFLVCSCCFQVGTRAVQTPHILGRRRGSKRSRNWLSGESPSVNCLQIAILSMSENDCDFSDEKFIEQSVHVSSWTDWSTGQLLDFYADLGGKLMLLGIAWQLRLLSRVPKCWKTDAHQYYPAISLAIKSTVLKDFWIKSLLRMLSGCSEINPMPQSVRPHFDPERSTTHDVVRQAIIPNSLQHRTGLQSLGTGKSPISIAVEIGLSWVSSLPTSNPLVHEFPLCGTWVIHPTARPILMRGCELN